MANEEHVKFLKEKGVEAWNEWRKQNSETKPNLSGANLFAANLVEANLLGTNLSGADLLEANLREANLSGANLGDANLSDADLRWADLSGADLVGANLREADLMGTDLGEANLSEANLSEADLSWANLSEANLSEANLTNSQMWGTVLADVDLSVAKGLDAVEHIGPSTVGIDTIYKSKGKITEAFLRGAGVPEPFIVQMKALVGAMDPIQFYSCFISYSSKDEEFAKRIYADLQREKVRCWFAPEDLRIGDEIRPKIDEAIRKYDKLLIVLSENSVGSPWVRKEVETAFSKEIRFETELKQRRTVLFPIQLDDAVKKTEEAWAADIRRTRHIGDFRRWKDHDKYKVAFERLMRDLKNSGQ